MKITHYDLCKITAERFLKESEIVLYEYQSNVSPEMPDVLCYNGAYTKLFEIKVDYQDFRRDKKKECRIEIDVKYWTRMHWLGEKQNRIIFEDARFNELIKQYPHLGRKRYYVCPKGLIQPEEVKNGWGLYWYNGRFSKKKESKNFKHDLFRENILLTHAFRKYANINADNILIKGY